MSAIAPSTGANKATMIPAMEFARPNLAVLIVVSVPALQNCLKNTGKKPAMTVVAKAEFAQSYRAHPKTAFLLSFNFVGAEIPFSIYINKFPPVFQQNPGPRIYHFTIAFYFFSRIPFTIHGILYWLTGR